MLVNTRYFPPPKTDASCQYCQDFNLSHPALKGMLGIPLEALRRSAISGCPSCEVLLKALDLQDLDPPDGQELVGVTLFSGAGSNRNASEAPLSLTLRLQTENRHFAELEIYTEGVPRIPYLCNDTCI
jgi:hypothetical protein